jgi:hypothetical protein
MAPKRTAGVERFAAKSACHDKLYRPGAMASRKAGPLSYGRDGRGAMDRQRKVDHELKEEANTPKRFRDVRPDPIAAKTNLPP